MGGGRERGIFFDKDNNNNHAYTSEYFYREKISSKVCICSINIEIWKEKLIDEIMYNLYHSSIILLLSL